MRSHLGQNERSYLARHRLKQSSASYKYVKRRRLLLEQLEVRTLLAGPSGDGELAAELLSVVLVSDAVAQAEQVRMAAMPNAIAVVYKSENMTTRGLVDLVQSISAEHKGALIGHLGIVAHGGPAQVNVGMSEALNVLRCRTIRQRSNVYARC